MKSRPKRTLLVVVLAVLICAFLFALNAGKMLVVDVPQRSDVIVVLAGETYRRPQHAVELLNQGYASRILIDVPAQTRIYESSQIQLAENYIHNLPQASAMSVCPITGLSTRDESRDVNECLAHETGSRILIVTSD